jgi:peptidoglycan/LPS O-acetylase OafA/YrhL
VQLAVGASVGEIARGLDETTARALRRGLRMIDHGLDVAWDMLIGTALILSGSAMRRRRGLGPVWAIPSVVLGVALIVLNAATFPWPPADRGLFDIGPLIGAFVMALAARLAILGRRAGT